jgi:RNA-dependent RNA polymerase
MSTSPSKYKDNSNRFGQRQRPTLPAEFRTQRPSNKSATNLTSTQPSPKKPQPSSHPKGRPNVSASGSVPNLKRREAWQSWPELTIKVWNLPSSITTWQLWKKFEREGTVVSIEIYESRQGVREGSAKIRFSPVPYRDFWSTEPVVMRTPDGQGSFQVKIAAEPKKRSGFQVPSPIRKTVWYPEKMSLIPSAIEFGLMFEESVMMRMRHVPSLSRNDLKFDVDLIRNRICIKFQLEVVAFPVKQQPITPKGAPKEILSQAERYMFQIPFGQLQRIYRVKVSETQWALVVSLDSPPQFYRRRPIESSHSDDLLVWGEFDAYYRQTDIVYDRNRLKTAAITLHKELAEIDIGKSVRMGSWNKSLIWS